MTGSLGVIRVRRLGGLLSVCVLVAVSGVIGGSPAAVSRSRVARPTMSGQQAVLAGLPTGAQASVSSVLGAVDRSYRVRTGRAGYYAINRAHGLQVGFDRSGVSVRAGFSRLSLRLEAAGYGSRLSAVRSVAPHRAGDSVSYVRGAVDEWYVNGPLGLEQGFTLTRPFPGSDGGTVVLALAFATNLRERLVDDGQAVVFETVAGRVLMRYVGLTAFDARGRALPARLSLREGRLRIQVDDRGARYPVRIDPFLQQGSKLVGAPSVGAARQGYSVALSDDGNTLIVGGEADDTFQGAAWVFTRSGPTWSVQAKLVGTGAIGDLAAGQGTSVALSADGSTALIGGPYDDDYTGATWVFVRSGSTWSQQAKLVGTGTVNKAEQGSSVALASDGNTALIGGPTDAGQSDCNGSQGAAWVFTRSGSTWSQQGPKLVGTGVLGYAEQGLAVALSGDGNTALIGGPFDGAASYCPPTNMGAAWVFARSGSTWSQQAKLVGNGPAAGSWPNQRLEGSSVALSVNGDTALIGGPADNNGMGAAWVFTRSGSSWSQQGSQLTASDEITGTDTANGGLFGSSAALSSDGNTALIGGRGDDADMGATWLFTHSGSNWVQQGSKLVGAGAVGAAQQGWSVALAGDASTLAIGGPYDNSEAGATWVFAPPALSVTSVSPAADRASVDVQVSLQDASTGTGGCDPAATYEFEDAELASTRNLGHCKFSLVFKRPETGIYAVALSATLAAGGRVDVSRDQYGNDVPGKFPVIIDSCRKPVEDLLDVDSLANPEQATCGVVVGPWDSDVAGLPQEVSAEVNHAKGFDLTPISVASVDPGDWPSKDLVVMKRNGAAWLPLDHGKDMALVQTVHANGLPTLWDGSGTKLTKRQLLTRAPAVVISAHGAWYTSEGLIRVPTGDEVTTYVPIGASMGDTLGIHVDTGHISGSDHRYVHTYKAGDLMPNFIFGPLTPENYDGLVGKYVTRVKDLATLNTLLHAHEGSVWISACAKIETDYPDTISKALSHLPIEAIPSGNIEGYASAKITDDGQLHSITSSR